MRSIISLGIGALCMGKMAKAAYRVMPYLSTPKEQYM